MMPAKPLPQYSKNPETETGLPIMGKSPQDYPWSMDNEVPRERDHEFFGTRDHWYGGTSGHSYGGNIQRDRAIVKLDV